MEYILFPKNMQESLLYDLWKSYFLSGQSLSWKGNNLKILDGGEINTHYGPDLKHARFEYNGIIYQGNVEFHVHIDDWYKHQHHQDPLYQDVLLHVIARANGQISNVTHNISQKEIPTFLLPIPDRHDSKTICLPEVELNPEKTISSLQKLALQRLKEKTIIYKSALKTFSAEKIFYHSFLRTLGYPYNKDIFEMLAFKIPASIYQKEKSNLVLLALYFGSAGFLDEKFNDTFALNLQKIFSSTKSILSFSRLKKEQWQFTAVRNSNHPHFRLTAWVDFVTSLKNSSPFQLYYSWLQQRFDYKSIQKMILDSLCQKPEGYWEDHYALQKPLKLYKNKLYISKQRAKEIMINLIIPLSISMASVHNSAGFISYLEGLYLSIPGDPSYQSLINKMPWIKDYGKLWKSFSIGQSFIYLDNHYCQKKKCINCPLSHSFVK